ncbi:MAG: hypothetical protein VX642_11235 [Bdellovibrionota bacterium]|nr:hypothetical protein [Bdellovibrionota bacterium]
MRYLIALLLILATNPLQAQNSDVFDSLLVDLELRTFLKDSIKDTGLSLGVRSSRRPTRNSIIFEIAPLRPAEAIAVSVVKFEILQNHLFVEFDSTLEGKKEHFKRAFIPTGKLDLNTMNYVEYREYSKSIAHIVLTTVLNEIFNFDLPTSKKYFNSTCKSSAS